MLLMYMGRQKLMPFFFLGYLYHVGEDGELQKLAEMLFGDEKQGGADETDGSV